LPHQSEFRFGLKSESQSEFHSTSREQSNYTAQINKEFYFTAQPCEVLNPQIAPIAQILHLRHPRNLRMLDTRVPAPLLFP
jgi:hypothetical protein